MEKEFRTITYGAKLGDGAMRLKLDTGKFSLIDKNIEVKAKVDLETGEVKFFVDPNDLSKLVGDE